MFKALIGNLKKLFGFNSKKQEEFDQAILTVLKAATDGRIHLSGGTDPGTESLASLAHSWSDAAVKISRIDDDLRDDCLSMVRFFSDPQTVAAESAVGLARIDGVFEKAGRSLQERRRLVDR